MFNNGGGDVKKGLNWLENGMFYATRGLITEAFLFKLKNLNLEMKNSEGCQTS